MTIYLLAGHTPGGARPDPGASGNGLTEARETVRVRDAVTTLLRKKGKTVVNDNDTDRLGTVLAKIPSSYKDIVCDIHFNAHYKPSATGVEVLVPDEHTHEELLLARRLAAGIANALGIRNRGVKTEADSKRGRLGVMRKQGRNVLIEVCFLTNEDDVAAYQLGFGPLCEVIARELAE